MYKYLAVGGMLAVLAWSGLRVYSARAITAVSKQSIVSSQQSAEELKEALDKLPAYKLTFLGAKFLKAGDYEFAKLALGMATEKDRFYRDAFRYYGYVLQALGENDQAELALRRAKTLDPRVSP